MSSTQLQSSMPGKVILDEIVPAGAPWGAVVHRGDILTIIDLEGQQAVDFLCYDVADPADRYSATNTLKVQRGIFIKLGTILYSDSGTPLMTMIEDTVGQHDTIYGCCSNPNNYLRFGVHTTESCYSNFEKALEKFGLDRSAIVPNINFFMCVAVLPDGSPNFLKADHPPGSYVRLRADRDVIAVLSNCPQMQMPVNGYNLTPVRAVVTTSESQSADS
jgi:hypothetical protein